MMACVLAEIYSKLLGDLVLLTLFGNIFLATMYVDLTYMN